MLTVNSLPSTLAYNSAKSIQRPNIGDSAFIAASFIENSNCPGLGSVWGPITNRASSSGFWATITVSSSGQGFASDTKSTPRVSQRVVGQTTARHKYASWVIEPVKPLGHIGSLRPPIPITPVGAPRTASAEWAHHRPVANSVRLCNVARATAAASSGCIVGPGFWIPQLTTAHSDPSQPRIRLSIRSLANVNSGSAEGSSVCRMSQTPAGKNDV